MPVSERKRTNQPGGNRGEMRSHFARLRYIAIQGRRRQGATQAEVCDEFDVSRSVVIRARRELGVDPDLGRKGRPKPWLRKNGPSDAVRERLAMVAQGMSYRQVADAAGVSRQAVADDVRRWPEFVEQLKREHASGDAREGNQDG